MRFENQEYQMASAAWKYKIQKVLSEHRVKYRGAESGQLVRMEIEKCLLQQ